MDWTDHPAILGYDQRDEGDVSVRNVLAAEVDEDGVRFYVNGQEVTRLHREDLRLDGLVGLRINHALNLHVSRLDVVPAG